MGVIHTQDFDGLFLHAVFRVEQINLIAAEDDRLGQMNHLLDRFAANVGGHIHAHQQRQFVFDGIERIGNFHHGIIQTGLRIQTRLGAHHLALPLVGLTGDNAAQGDTGQLLLRFAKGER